MGRSLARESAMKILFQMELNNDFSSDALNIFFENNSFEDDEKEYILQTVNQLNENIKIIDENIEKYAQGWKLNRIPKVDLSILRIAINEILHRKDIPVEVSINEAINISKKYSTNESSKFINGLLGSFVRDMEHINKL
ncbi:NusB antitermination factor [Proteiniborus ethanoligenes]|uniref:Transcription antitermination protein NusB n=1 Tax=Proteiniborus ethanoligenes TaxID=415015 RepID=A0A1H3K8L8_9FIRM|nr:transcription antitermination factor NusB [Proteiniborus ethanoligenes]TAH63409.1 MAG: transcription antitermination factor NusB [Gottschalkiaceae bacterium]SDY48443.1 NusB antitermination factor [Proteiniborus ethanoligenes]